MHTSKIRSAFFTAALVFTAAPAVLAQLMTTAVPFLRIEPDSRIAGMGNAGVAASDNAAAVFWNPAALAYQTGSEANLTHANWLPNFNVDLFYDYGVVTHHVPGIATFAGSITYLNLGEQQRTDEQGNDLGTFRSYDMAVAGSMGIPITNNFALGGSARFIYSILAPNISVSGQETRAGSSIAVDLAALYRTNEFVFINRRMRLRAGMNLSNVGSGVTYSDAAQEDPLPTTLRAGFAYYTELDRDGFNTLTLSFEASKLLARRDSLNRALTGFEPVFRTWGTYDYNDGTRDISLSLANQMMLGGGMEYWYNKQFAIRGGYYYEHPDNGARQYFTLGAGIRIKKFGIDFSYIAARENSPLANQMRFSGLYRF